MATTLDAPAEVRPNVRQRAADFEQERAVDAYLRILGVPLQADDLTVTSMEKAALE